MKKTILILLVISMMLALGACGGSATIDESVIAEIEPIPDPIYNPLTNLEISEPIEARMILVSIDNHPNARPQYAVSQADIVYEVPAEGRIPRLLGLFYEKSPQIIGGVRSARPYMIDIAREWDALFVHCGGSEEALSELYQGSVDDMDEIGYDSYFWRDHDRYAPHNLMTSTENIYDYLDYREKATIQEEVRVMDFLDVGEIPVGAKADWINVKYQWANNYYKYEHSINCYSRMIGNDAYIDAATGDPLKISNIIVQKVSSHVVDSYGHLDIDMTAGGEAWLFTGGIVVTGTWSRENLDSPTIFVDELGERFKLSAGQTWIEIIDGDVTFTYKDNSVEASNE